MYDYGLNRLSNCAQELETARMYVYKHSAFDRLEIVETGRRRRWSDAEKLRIVMESQSAPRLVSATARRHGISRSQLGTWLL